MPSQYMKEYNHKCPNTTYSKKQSLLIRTLELPIIRLADIVINILADTDNQSNVYVTLNSFGLFLVYISWNQYHQDQ